MYDPSDADSSNGRLRSQNGIVNLRMHGQLLWDLHGIGLRITESPFKATEKFCGSRHCLEGCGDERKRKEFADTLEVLKQFGTDGARPAGHRR